MILRKHHHDRDFTIIDNATLRDPRLSWKATGLLVFLLSLPEDWNVDGRALAREKEGGRDATYSGLKELEACGYLAREKVRVEGGKWATVVHVYESPQSGESATESGLSGAGSPGPGQPGALRRTESKDPDKEDPPPEAEEPDPLMAAARIVVKDWWETMSPKPAQNFVAVVKIVHKMLRAGWSPQSVRWALDRAPTPSVGTLEFALRSVRRGSVEQVRSAAAQYLERRAV